MNLQQYQKHILETLGDLSPVSLATDWINQALIDIALVWPWQFLQRRLTLTTVASTAEYSLPVQTLKVISLTQTTSPYHLRPLHISRYDEVDPNPTETGDPQYYILFENYGVQNNPSSASVLTFSSSQANYTTGTVTVVQGSRRITGAGTTFATSHEGQPFKLDSDPNTDFYEIDRFVSTTAIDLTTVYTRVDAATQTYKIGDTQPVRIIGTSGGNTVEEVITLNGTTSVASSNSYTAVDSFHLSFNNFGRISVTSNAAAVTVATIQPRTLRPRYVRIRLHPTPSSAITVNVRTIVRPRTLHFWYDQPEFGPEFDRLIIQQALIYAFQWKDDSRLATAVQLRDRYLNELVSKEAPEEASSKFFAHMESLDSRRFLRYGASFPEPF